MLTNCQNWPASPDWPVHKYNAFVPPTESASYEQIGHPSRVGSVWPEVVLSLAELMCSIFGLANMAGQLS